MSDEPTQPRSRIGLILSVLWLIALMVALSGQCISQPDYVERDIGLNPDAPAASTNGAAPTDDTDDLVSPPTAGGSAADESPVR